MWLVALVFSALVTSSSCGNFDFPPGLKFGAATASYQVEGAWNVSDKSESIWDRFTHENPDIFKGATGDVACDSYHLYKEDVKMAKKLGLHFYRFSISWPRLLPSGFPNHISEDGSRYYNDLIDELLKNGIEPVITMYHWDLPQALQDLGGWANPLISDWFADYAKVLYELYADRVKTWITLNEPIIICDVPYNTGLMAPGIVDPKVGKFLCSKNVLLAHAKAWRVYDEEYKPKYGGKMTVGNHLVWYEPYSEEDKYITELAQQYTLAFGISFWRTFFRTDTTWDSQVVSVQKNVLGAFKKRAYSFLKAGNAAASYLTLQSVMGGGVNIDHQIGRYSHPIYSKEGGWPPLLEKAMAELSEKDGFPWSRLPPFTQEEIELVKGTFDFYGFNHYTSRLVRQAKPGEQVGGGFGVPFWGDQELGFYLDGKPEWELATNGWIRIYPEGIRKQLNWLRERYGDMEFFIFENGLSTAGYNLEDDDRIEYYRVYLEQVLLAMKEDGIKVTGYTAWTLMDNFEWVGDAYDTKFGLYEVDFDSPERKRTPRKSARFYAEVVKNRSLNISVPIKFIDEL